MNRLMISVFCLALFSLSFARTFYVSGTGSDGQAGTSQAPWRTLQKAADSVAAPGDSVIVRAGQYAGFYLETSGSRSRPIVFSAETGAIITSRNPTTADGVNLEGANWVTVRGFTVMNRGTITRAGMRAVTDTGVVFSGNRIDSCGRWGIITGFSEDILIENNVCSRSVAEHGIYFGNSADDPVIRGNVSYANNGCGIHMNADLSMGGDGIISRALVENNIVYGNGNGGGSGINCDGVQNSRFQNNLLFDNHASGFSLYQIDAAAGASSDTLVNNTVIMASNGRWAVNIQNASTGAVLRNNILLNRSGRGAICLTAEGMPGFSSDYNAVKDLLTPDDAAWLTLAQWKTQTGQDAHSFTAAETSLFVSPSGNDYRLKPGCPATNTGTASLAPAKDLAGTTRPVGGLFDIGAYEWTPDAVETGRFPAAAGALLIYPNPCRSKVKITLPGSGPVSAAIYDMDGRLVKKLGRDLIWDASGVPAGLYVCKAISAGRMMSLRFAVVQ